MEQKQGMDEIYDKDQIKSDAPNWAKYRKLMTSEFYSPYRQANDPLAQQINKAITLIDNLKPEKDGPAFLGDSSQLAYTYPEVKNVSIPQKPQDLDSVIADTVKLFEGMPHVASPMTMCNVWPQPNTASIKIGRAHV